MTTLYLLVIIYTAVSGGSSSSLGPMDIDTCQKAANSLIAAAPGRLIAFCQPLK
jgi:hypothetical protein